MLEREIFENALRLIDRPAAWTQKAEARAGDGAQVAPEDPAACCWCLIGAIEHAVAEIGADDRVLFQVIARLGDAAETLFGTRAINYVNDDLGHAAVCRTLEHAIAHSAIIEAAEAEDQPTEVERLRAAVGVCLARINQLESALQPAQPCGRLAGGLLPAIVQTWH